MSRRSLKRVSPKLQLSDSIASDTLKEKRRKLERKRLNNGSSKSTKTKHNSVSIDNSSDSSSNEFKQPPLMSEFKLNRPNSDINRDIAIPDFTSIENNILKGVTTLSDSDDSDFDEVEINPTLPQFSSIKTDNLESTSTKKLKKHESDLDKTPKNREDVKKRNTERKGRQKSRQSKFNSSQSTKIKESELLNSIDVNKMDVSQLLALGEGSSTNIIKTENKTCNLESDSENELSDWEDVEGLEVKPEKHSIPQEGVEVRLEMPEIYRRRKNKGFDWESHVRRRLNRVKRELQVLIHKVHLLCWIAHGRYVNAILNSEVLMGISLSLIPSQHCLPQKHTNLNYLEQIVKWFSKTVTLEEKVENSIEEPLLDSLQRQFQTKTADTTRDLVLMFISLLRAIGVRVRLMLSFQPLPLKPSSENLLSNNPKKRHSSVSSQTKDLKTETKNMSTKVDDKNSATKKKNDKQGSRTPKKSEETRSTKKSQKVSTNSSKKRSQTAKIKATEKTPNESEITDDKMDKLKRTLRQRKQIMNKYRDHSSSSDENETENVNKLKENDKLVKPSITKIPSTSGTQPSSEKQRKSNCGNKRKSTKKTSRKTENNSDSDFEPVTKMLSDKKQIYKGMSSDSENDFEPKKISPKRKSLGEVVDRRVLSSDSSGDNRKRKAKKGVDVWAEVYLEEEEQWISVDVPTSRVHCVAELYSRATQPVTYVIGFSNDQTLKDVTCRYCTQFSTATRKLRVDDEWWRQSLKPFLGARTARDREEDEELNRLMLDRPLPTTFKELKNHPLYALRDDLLKFEAIYPPDAPPLGYIKGKPIYARECVHVLHSREAWLKEAKVVRLGEKPYKIVKARPKYDKMTGQFIKDLPLEVFGSWQVDDYIPPLAVDGKVPRNEYGNVELFKPSMLPKGTVHLPITGLNRVARKLGIDCAPAMIGFDFHAGGTHPVFDGFIVCEEFKDILLDAWNQEQDEAVKRQQEKLEKRVYGNWKRLIKGLLIRERLKLRYSFGEEAGPSEPRLLSSISESNKLLSIIDGSSKKKKGNVGRGRKSTNVPGNKNQKGRKSITPKKRKVLSEEEDVVSESDDDDEEEEEEEEEFDSDRDWD